MKKNTLKKLMVISIGTMTLLGSSISASAAYWHIHEDADKDHRCDVMMGETQCSTTMGICADPDHDHYCDYGCGKTFGVHEDTNLDHLCDYDCKELIGVCADSDNDHMCDYGCGKWFGGDHNGGVATCKDRAICDYCGKPYGEVNAASHAGGTEVRNTKEATCVEEGYTGDTYCKGCTTKIESGTPIPIDSNNHKFNSIYNVEATCSKGLLEYIMCSLCGEFGSLYDHYGYMRKGHDDTDNDHYCNRTNRIYYNNANRYDDVICNERVSECSGGTATCKDAAICDICNKPYGDVDLTNHVDGTEIRDDKPVTCAEDGYTGDTYCKGCNTKLQTGRPIAKLNHIDKNKNHVCDRENCKSTISDHTGGTATCKDLAVCEYCGNTYGEVDSTNHVGDTEIRNVKSATCTEDGYTGDTYCISCNTKLQDGEPIAKLNHIDENKDHVCDKEDCKVKLSDHTGGTATCKDAAICEYCNTAYGELNALNHVGDTEIRNAKPATCTEDGYTGDTYCTSCNTKLLDGTIIPATGHIDSDSNNECDTCNIIINETEAETEPITEKETEKPAKKKETEKQTESKPVIEETESNNTLPEAPKTGDSTPIITLFSLLSASIVVIFACVTCRSRKEY